MKLFLVVNENSKRFEHNSVLIYKLTQTKVSDSYKNSTTYSKLTYPSITERRSFFRCHLDELSQVGLSQQTTSSGTGKKRVRLMDNL